MLELTNLTRRFGDFYAIRDLSIRVQPGEVYGFLGPNGAGKTTTMKIIVGLMRPSGGQVRVDGIDVLKEPIRSRRVIGYIPDRPYLYEKLTAREFLSFTASIFGLDRATDRARSQELLSLFGLSDWANELIESYSHGMKQRLTMAAALLHRPKLLIVDEPMVGLDPRGAVLVKQLFKRLCADGSGTVFLSTHTLEVAEELCDRVAILQHGRMLAEGSMADLRRQVGADDGGGLEQIFLQLTGGVEVDASVQTLNL